MTWGRAATHAFVVLLVLCSVVGCKKKKQAEDKNAEAGKTASAPAGARRPPVPTCKKSDDFLSTAEKNTLLTLARRTVEAAVRRRGPVDADKMAAGLELTDTLKKPMGAFVTLKKQGRLRGCIGYLRPVAPLYKAVVSNAASAALRDRRFRPVAPAELSDLHVEISVLSVPVPVAGYEDIEIGCHGIILEKHGRRATYLPHVAPEQGWDRATTLSHLSRKAGISPDGWRHGASFRVYTAIVFEEKADKNETR